jgi:hypothetical protein
LFAVVPNGRKLTNIQTLTIGNDSAANLLTSHNHERGRLYSTPAATSIYGILVN